MTKVQKRRVDKSYETHLALYEAVSGTDRAPGRVGLFLPGSDQGSHDGSGGNRDWSHHKDAEDGKRHRTGQPVDGVQRRFPTEEPGSVPPISSPSSSRSSRTTSRDGQPDRTPPPREPRASGHGRRDPFSRKRGRSGTLPRRSKPGIAPSRAQRPAWRHADDEQPTDQAHHRECRGRHDPLSRRSHDRSPNLPRSPQPPGAAAIKPSPASACFALGPAARGMKNRRL